MIDAGGVGGGNGSGERRISDEVFARLAPMASALGIDLGIQGEDGKPGRATFPEVNVTRPILEMALEVAQIVRNEGLYLLNGQPVTIEADGRTEAMEPERFVSWLPKFCVVTKGRDEDGKPRRVDLQAKRASLLLKTDLFKAALPEVTRILPARLPVYTKEAPGVRLLGKGYDAEHRVFVTSDAPEVEEWCLDDATGYLRGLYRTFPWGDSGRSLAAQISAQVGIFAQLLFPDAQAVPLYFWNANLEGSGKSILAEMAVTPVYGMADTADFGQGDEFLKVLASRAFAYASYLWLDDLDGFIKSQTLNRWVVQGHWSARRLYSMSEMSVAKRCMTMITGNRATLSDDLVRRMVLIDLFSEKTAAERLAERKEGVEITSDWLKSEKNRRDMLSALWALVRNWAEQGKVSAPRCIASFVEWTRVVGGIVYAAGFGDAFAPAELADAGDKWIVEWNTLFSAVVRSFKPTKAGVSIPLPEWCAMAREHGLYVDKLGELEIQQAYLEENPRLWKITQDAPFGEKEKREQALRYMHPQKQASPFAKILRKRGGQTFMVDGQRYRFADRNASTSTFTVYLLD